MCELMENYVNKRAKEIIEEATEKALKEVKAQFVVNLWNNGFTDMQQISQLTDFPLEEVKKLLEGKTA